MMQVRCPVLVGRDRERERLVAALDGAGAGRGAAAFVVGEPGLGKSRLAREIATLAGERGMPVAVGRSVQGNPPAPLRPWSEAVLSLTRDIALPPRATLGPYAAVLGRLVPEWAGPLSPETAAAPLLGEAVLRLWRVLAPDGGLLVLEDLHWADPETLAVTEYVCDHAAGERVLVLGTLRDGEGQAAVTLADALAERGSAERITLAPLGPADVEAMIRACGVAPTREMSRAEGIPLLVEELLGDPSGTVPRGMAESVAGRTARLGPDARRVLVAAAVLGRRFDWRLLEGVTPALATALAAATGAGLLVPDGDGYAFRHALTRDAVLATAAAPEQAEIAAVLGAGVRRRHPDLDGDAAVLAAGLAARAGDAGAAALFATAARRAVRDGALDSAAALLGRGIALARTAAARIELADALAEVHCRAGRLDTAHTTTRELLALLRETGGPEPARARAHVRLARACAEAARWDDAEAELAAAGEPAGADGVEAELVRALVRLGRSVTGGPDPHRADAHVAIEASAAALVEPALTAGRPDLACDALEVSGRAARGRDTDAAVAAFERAHALALRHDLPLALLSALHELGTIDMFTSGRRDRLLTARRDAVRSGAVRLTAVLDLQLVAAHHMHGDRVAAQEAAARALDGATALGIEPMRVIALAIAACPAGLTADRAAVEAAIAAIPPGALDGDPDSRSSLWGTTRATCSLLREDRAAAVLELETAAEVVRGAVEIRPQTWWGFWVLLRALDGGDATGAIAALRACPAGTNRQNVAYAELAEAVLAGRRGDGARAAATVETWDATRLPWAWLRHLGRRLVAEAALADGWGDPRAWLTDAATFFDGFAPAVAAACRALLDGPDLPDDLRRVGVTPREAEVLALLGRGLTGSRELADHLVISPRTVEKHVESLCRKLGARSRGQLAALAARRDQARATT